MSEGRVWIKEGEQMSQRTCMHSTGTQTQCGEGQGRGRGWEQVGKGKWVSPIKKTIRRDNERHKKIVEFHYTSHLAFSKITFYVTVVLLSTEVLSFFSFHQFFHVLCNCVKFCRMH